MLATTAWATFAATACFVQYASDNCTGPHERYCVSPNICTPGGVTFNCTGGDVTVYNCSTQGRGELVPQNGCSAKYHVQQESGTCEDDIFLRNIGIVVGVSLACLFVMIFAALHCRRRVIRRKYVVLGREGLV